MMAGYSRGSVARLNYTSVPVVSSSNQCLLFWYFMSSGPVGSLAVHMALNGSTRRMVWRREASHGGTGISGRWLQAEIELSTHNLTLTEVL